MTTLTKIENENFFPCLTKSLKKVMKIRCVEIFCDKNFSLRNFPKFTVIWQRGINDTLTDKVTWTIFYSDLLPLNIRKN